MLNLIERRIKKYKDLHIEVSFKDIQPKDPVVHLRIHQSVTTDHYIFSQLKEFRSSSHTTV